MKKIFLTHFTNAQQGFSLPELSIAIGLLGGISLITMNVISDQKSNESFVKGRTQINNAVSLVKASISDKENCRSMLSGKILATNNSILDLTSLKVQVKSSPGSSMEILKANTNYNGFKTDAIKLYTGARSGVIPSPLPTSLSTNSLVELIQAKIDIDFRIKNKSMSKWTSSSRDRIITETIPLFLTVLKSNRTVTDCEGVLSDTNNTAKEKFCESLGGAATWNQLTQKCTLISQTCPTGQIMVKMGNLGNMQCQDIKNHINLADLFSTQECTSTGSFRIINESGKLKIDCTSGTTSTPTATPTSSPTPTATVSPTPALPAKWALRNNISSTCTTLCSHIELPTCTNALDGDEYIRTTCRTGASGCSDIYKEVKQYRCEFD